MDLYPGDLRCVGEELDQLEVVVFAMSASASIKDAQQKITAKIRDPDEEDIFFDKIPINNKIKEFHHKLVQRGLYEMCFELHDGKLLSYKHDHSFRIDHLFHRQNTSQSLFQCELQASES
jgi:GTPase Era involved in 16S rRNA processing